MILCFVILSTDNVLRLVFVIFVAEIIYAQNFTFTCTYSLSLRKRGEKNHMEPGWVSREVTLARQCFSLPGTVRCSGVVSRFIVMVKQPLDVLPQLSLLHSLRVTHCLRKLKCVQKMTFTGNLQHGLTMVTLKHIITTKT